jgi:uncharacterized protein
MMLGFIIMDYWWLIIPGIVLGLYAQVKLSSTYSRYSRIGNAAGMTGAQAAREILNSAGLHNMPVHATPGHLTDHYDPRKKALFLSGENYHGTSLASVGVAAHEAGHALQHQAAYAWLNLRMAMVPMTQFASMAWMFIAILGFVLRIPGMITIAIVIFAIIALFQIITLPVEFDASRRAKEQLIKLGLIRGEEQRGVSKVLNAAAMTYVAAMITAVLQLLQFILIARDRDRA